MGAGRHNGEAAMPVRTWIEVLEGVSVPVGGGWCLCLQDAVWHMEDGRHLTGLRYWTSSLGVEGSLTNPDTPGGQDGGEADPAAVHGRVQGRGGQAAAGRRQGAGRGRDRAGAEPRPAERVAQRAPGGRLGGGAGRPQGGAGRDPAAAT